MNRKETLSQVVDVSNPEFSQPRSAPRTRSASRKRNTANSFKKKKKCSLFDNSDIFTAEDSSGTMDGVDDKENSCAQRSVSIVNYSSVHYSSGYEQCSYDERLDNTSHSNYIHDSFCVPDDDDIKFASDEHESFVESEDSHCTSKLDDEREESKELNNTTRSETDEEDYRHDSIDSNSAKNALDSGDEIPKDKNVIDYDEVVEDSLLSNDLSGVTENAHCKNNAAKSHELISRDIDNVIANISAIEFEPDVCKSKRNENLFTNLSELPAEKKSTPISSNWRSDSDHTSTSRTPLSKTPKQRLQELAHVKSMKSACSSKRKITKKEMDFLFLESLDSSDKDFNPYADMLYFSKYREQLAGRLYRIFQRHVFDNKLPSDMPIKWSKSLKSTAGMFRGKVSKFDNGKHSIEGYIELSVEICNSAARVRDVLLHECCHAAVRFIDEDLSEKHGKKWNQWCERAFSAFPSIQPVSRCHRYEVASRAKSSCEKCGSKMRKLKKKDIKICNECFERSLSHPQCSSSTAENMLDFNEKDEC
ncbi:sprT-like family domain-containing protein [Ditylenchus destructor]|nr:sprT-like family domain-containing protein [Ditylenchus destructor]